MPIAPVTVTARVEVGRDRFEKKNQAFRLHLTQSPLFDRLRKNLGKMPTHEMFHLAELPKRLLVAGRETRDRLVRRRDRRLGPLAGCEALEFPVWRLPITGKDDYLRHITMPISHGGFPHKAVFVGLPVCRQTGSAKREH